MSEELSTITDDASVILAAGVALAELTETGPGQVRALSALVPEGYRLDTLYVNTETAGPRPLRKRGVTTVFDAGSFCTLHTKHALPETETFGDEAKLTVTAVVNAGDEAAGWGDHRIVLTLRPTPEWTDWLAADGKIGSQVEFAEFIEQHLPEFVDPAGAHMLELAQSFQANKSAKFESSKRLTSGETQLEYREEINATAGKSGDIAIPDTFDVAIAPFEGADTFRVRARLRYRLDNGSLRIGYVLERPHAVVREAFKAVTAHIAANTRADVLNGSR